VEWDDSTRHERQRATHTPDSEASSAIPMDISKITNPGDLILDTHVGSASSLIAYEQEGFEYVGYELDEDYYNAATKRMKQVLAQKSLF
jgi:DNA modification methylase